MNRQGDPAPEYPFRPPHTREVDPVSQTTTRRRVFAVSAARSRLAPRWLARLGWSGWLVTGTVVGFVATVVAASIALPVLAPLIVAVLLAVVLAPVVSWLCRHRMGRGWAAAIAALVPLAVVVALTFVALHALRGQGSAWAATAGTAGARLRSAVGTDPVAPLLDATQRHELLLGLAGFVVNGTAAAVGLLFWGLVTLYILFFLLKDGPRFVDGLAARLPVPLGTARELLTDAGFRLRRYLVGTTVVAAVDAVVITLAAALLRLPLLLVIALVTFATAYVPYLGAWLSGIFVVVIALGSGGVETAIWMLVIVLITQNLLEAVLRPLAFGAALDLHPLTILAATVVGALVGGVVGVFVGPPLAAIAVSWRRTLRSDGRAEAPG
ncbi:MAG: AI-2E family transporter [Actinobacteria bacterium]|nr:MAG: AI-2E family transporter [Actinomycetota bacterium]